MAITQDTNGTWSFTLGTETHGGYTSLAAAQEALYDAEHGLPPEDIKEWIDSHYAPAAPAVYVRLHLCDDELNKAKFGTIDWVDHCADVPDGRSVDISLDPDWAPMIYLPGQNALALADFLSWLPSIIAVCTDPQLLAAVAAHPGTKIPD